MDSIIDAAAIYFCLYCDLDLLAGFTTKAKLFSDILRNDLSCMNRKVFFVTTIVTAFVWGQLVRAGQDDFADIKAQITKQHDESVKRLQDWIGQVSIAAENRGYPEGAEYMAKLARDAGFQQATVINTKGKPGVFATLDAGAPKTVGLYFMYDVKQFDPRSGLRRRRRRDWSTSRRSAK